MIGAAIQGVNERKRRVDTQQELRDLESGIIDRVRSDAHLTKQLQCLTCVQDITLVERGRKLLREHHFKRVSLNGGATQKNTLFLFNDLVLLLKKKGDSKEKRKFTFRAMMSTDGCYVWDLDPSNNSGTTTNSTGDGTNYTHAFVVDKPHAFQVMSTNSSDRIVVYASSAQEKDDWLVHINTCIGESGTLSFGSVSADT